MNYNIGIIGASKVGTNLARIFSTDKSLHVVGIYSNSKIALAETINIINVPIIQNILQLVNSCDIIFITTKDKNIAHTWEYIQNSNNTSWQDKVFIHCSGLLTSEVFYNNETNGASLHPIFPFNHKNIPMNTLRQIQFSLEGGTPALSHIKPILKSLNLKYFIIDKVSKPLYHYACFILSSGINALLAYVIQITQNTDIDPFKLLPLSANAINNLIDSNDITKSLTGPIARGDTDVLSDYINLISQNHLPTLKFIIEQLSNFTNKEHQISLEKLLIENFKELNYEQSLI